MDKHHPDFKRTLTKEQRTWCARNGIEVQPWVCLGQVSGFYFSRGERWVEPVRANASCIYLMEVDRSEDGDGAKVVASFDRLRDALAALRKA